MKKTIIMISVMLVLMVSAFLVFTSIYIVPEGRQAVVKQFGRIVAVVIEPGLKFKLPFPFQSVVVLEKRIINWDGKPEIVPTRDGKNILVDTTARWRIADARNFVETLGDKETATRRLTGILDGATREVIRAHNRIETIRNSNAILEEIERRKQEIEERRKEYLEDHDNQQIRGDIDPLLEGGELLKLAELEEELDSGVVELILVGREELSNRIVETAREGLDMLGIELIDLQLRRVATEELEEKQVYERMITERQRIAQEIRSAGKGEQARIRGETDKMLKEIESQAYRTVQEIKGKAEGEAIKIYADAVGRDENLYEFLRTMEMYKAGLRSDSHYILSADSEFLRILKEGSSSNR